MIPLLINNAVRRNSVYSFCFVHSTVSPRTRALKNNIFPLTLSLSCLFLDDSVSVCCLCSRSHRHLSWINVKYPWQNTQTFQLVRRTKTLPSSLFLLSNAHTHTHGLTHSRWIFRRILIANKKYSASARTFSRGDFY